MRKLRICFVNLTGPVLLDCRLILENYEGLSAKIPEREEWTAG